VRERVVTVLDDLQQCLYDEDDKEVRFVFGSVRFAHDDATKRVKRTVVVVKTDRILSMPTG
jgi:hypothetical protein